MKLAVIGQITALEPIEGADRILKATVFCGDAGTWIGVVGLDHRVGDRVTVFLQDAMLPPDPRWAFMERHKWRVRMARFKGMPSECVIVDVGHTGDSGTDMTEATGVTKYSKPIPAGGQGDAVCGFPSFIPKTDEPNFQAVPHAVHNLMWCPWEARLKYDGSSCTVWKDEAGELHVASRNWELKEFTASGAANIYWRVVRRYNWTPLPYGLALQFEVVGPGVQGNPAGLKELDGRAFNLYDFLRYTPLSSPIMAELAEEIGMPVAELVYAGLGFTCSDDELREMAQKLTYPNGKPAEGMVVRSLAQDISFKVLSLSYKD